ncbi:hypothetical protein [Phocaeicola coprocola]|uniref:hypothetical protein n=1 Tax=Phocaeicola coprocola TaxID=310298 RepID=UPI001C38833F|nr:hypothetical protein [Phocaeicola coprocola]MBV4031280.1 hypothetical protein [Phocaeicola coprocola]MBV4059503.1 hypothetical protein [Phocaeicola coprocola]
MDTPERPFLSLKDIQALFFFWQKVSFYRSILFESNLLRHYRKNTSASLAALLAF